MTEIMETLSVLALLVFVIGSMASMDLSLKMNQIIAPLKNFKFVTPEQLAEAGIVLPERVEFKPGQADKAEWAEQTSSEGDLVVLVSHGRSFGKNSVEIQELGRSVVAVAASKAPRWETGHVAPRISVINP